MAKRALKVFQTSIGFDDAYVAAPSRKAALAAWGASKDLFARGMATVVTDAKLAAPALTQPGVVLRVARGTAAEHLADLATSAPARAGPDLPHPQRAHTPPRPSRKALDAAEATLARARSAFEEQLAEVDARIASLQHERSSLRVKRDKDVAEMKARRDKVAAAYDRALDAWKRH